MNPLTLVHVVFRNRLISKLFDPADFQPRQTRIEPLVVGRKKDRGPNHRQPLGRRLLTGVFADDQVPGIPVDHRPDFRDLPVVESEHINFLMPELLAQVLEALFDPFGQHFGLSAVCGFQLIKRLGSHV